MAEYDDLEITISKHDDDHYKVDLRWVQYSSLRSDPRMEPSVIVPCQVFKDLHNLPLDTAMEDYGHQLQLALFGAGVKDFYKTAFTAASANDRGLRLRLYNAANDPLIHSICWEALEDPLDEREDTVRRWLGMNDRILFSRYLNPPATEQRPLRLPYRRGDLKGVVAVAAPNNLASDQFDPIQPDVEITRACESVQSLCATTVLNEKGAITFNRLKEGMRGIDIVYLVAHGELREADEQNQDEDEHYIWLENEDHSAASINATELVNYLASLSPEEQPRLVILATCDSAKTSRALAALGPLLSRDAAIPAVIAMQGKVTVDTVSEFMQEFFADLARYGEIDRAMAAGRRRITDRFDRWMPSLYLSLKKGTIWGSGFNIPSRDNLEQNWDSLLLSIHEGMCVPILGPELLEPLIGSARGFAEAWAADRKVEKALGKPPLNVTQVSQYLSTHTEDAIGIKSLYVERMGISVQSRYENDLKQHSAENGYAGNLPKISEVLATHELAKQPNHPYHMLATLPFPIIITANPDSLLADTMRAIGRKQPEIAMFMWNDDLSNRRRKAVHKGKPSLYISELDTNNEYVPSPKHPVIYHLLGRWEDRESLVLTEDDYFDYLMHINLHLLTGDHPGDYSIHNSVEMALKTGTLLFIGFHLDDWSFRVLLRSIACLGDQGRIHQARKKLSVAVELDPISEDREPSEVRQYFESYYRHVGEIKVSWSNTFDFIQELHDRYIARYGSASATATGQNG